MLFNSYITRYFIGEREKLNNLLKYLRRQQKREEKEALKLQIHHHGHALEPTLQPLTPLWPGVQSEAVYPVQENPAQIADMDMDMEIITTT